MSRRIAHVSLLVRDYDEAIRWFTSCLGFGLIEDTPQADGKRWVLVGPAGRGGTTLLLARATKPGQTLAVGNQTGGRVFLFLETDDFSRDYSALKAAGVTFVEEPRDEPYGRVVVFQDLYGNRWDLVERRRDPG